ncbi:MAG: HEAT repeat domain-containing protein, partial [Candidatus Anstonellales archaeon]
EAAVDGIDISTAVPKLENLLEDENADADVKKAAAEALGEAAGMGNERAALNALTEGLKNENADVRKAAAMGLKVAAVNGSEELRKDIVQTLKEALGNEKNTDVIDLINRVIVEIERSQWLQR